MRKKFNAIDYSVENSSQISRIAGRDADESKIQNSTQWSSEPSRGYENYYFLFISSDFF